MTVVDSFADCIDLDGLKRIWPRVVKRLLKNSRRAADFFGEEELVEFSNSQLKIKADALICARLARPGVKTLVEQTLANELGICGIRISAEPVAFGPPVCDVESALNNIQFSVLWLKNQKERVDSSVLDDSEHVLLPSDEYTRVGVFIESCVQTTVECIEFIRSQPARNEADLGTMPYSEYLQTEHWATMRRLAKEQASYSCEVCNCKDQLDVHHRTYDRRGCEKLSDLTVLCRDCHGLFHKKYGAVKR